MIKKMNSFKRLLTLIVLIAISKCGYSQNVRGYYISNVGSWLGDTQQETDILEYTQGNGFNYILFYDLGQINWSSTTEKNKLASFISRARTLYGVVQVGAVVEVYSFVTNYILPYNIGRTHANEKFDVINQEFEFWVNASISSSYCSKFLSPNGYSCDTAGAFKFCNREFKKIDSLCAAQGLISEFYLGWPNKGQMQQIASRADRILLHAYRPTDADVYAYSKNRLKDLASLNANKKVIALFSSEPAFMGSWLNSHPQTRPYQTYESDLAAETATFKQYIDLQGYHWYTYQYMPKTMLATASITASGPLSFCSGGSVTLTANSGTAYHWSPGGQTTHSITVTTPGSYTVRVTNSGGTSATSSPIVVSLTTSGSTPTVTPSGPLSFCPGGSVTLTSSSSSAYLWSNGATTQSINVSNSGNYSVVTGGSLCSGTSQTVTVNANAVPATPTVSASGSLNICPGSPVTLTSSVATGYLWSNGATTRSIVVSSAGSYTVNAYNGPNCYATSVTKTVTLKTSPVRPTVSANGSTTLPFNSSSVSLSSSSANAYLWSSGQTTRTISVSAQGSYTVTITGTNGCRSTSDPVAVKKDGCAPPPVPTVALSGTPVISPGQSITLTSSQSGGYLWSTGATTRSISVSTAGVYTVRTYIGASCFSISSPVSISVLAPKVSAANINSAVSTENKIAISVYPNPVRNELKMVCNVNSTRECFISACDLTGRILVREDFTAVEGMNTISLNTSMLPQGIYLLNFNDGDSKQTVRFVKE
jgi:hypothetical protein